MLNEKKVAQMAAYFLHRRGGRMSHLKLTKLLYLAERGYLQRFGSVMTGDKPVSLEHGPALSSTLDLTQGFRPSVEGGWETWISDKENHEVELRQAVNDGSLDELSRADCEVLEQVWHDFGAMTRWEIRDFTHRQCQEWEDPNGSSAVIPFKRILTAVGYQADAAEELSKELASYLRLDRLLVTQ